MSKKIVLAGAILILFSIILGAMAAHALEKIVSDTLIETFEKGVRYQFYTGIVLLTIGLNLARIPIKIKPFIILNLLGAVLFCGGIYLYSLHETIPAFRPLAHVVPFGGVSFILAWIIFIVQLLRQR